MEKTEFGEIITKVSGIVNGSNKLPWLLSARPMLALLLAGGLWLPAFIAVLVIHVDDDSGSKSAMFVCLSINQSSVECHLWFCVVVVVVVVRT